MHRTWRIDTISFRKYTVLNYAHKFRGFIPTKYISLIPLLYLESRALTSQLYAASAVLQMNKDIYKLWRYALL
jgi:hypothetical protein